MNSLTKRMHELKAEGKKALIPFLTAGDPDFSSTAELLPVLAENGADVIELGVPFSDPLADGPVLQAAAGRALAAGATPDCVFRLVREFRQNFATPVVLLVYYNNIFRLGTDRFCKQAALAGVDGLVVPDLPFEEAGELDIAAAECGLINIRFVSPTTTDRRLEKICETAAGFIYCVSVAGVTGERSELDGRVAGLVRRAAAFTAVPVIVGFGISTPRQAADAASVADGVIVGSALVARLAAEKEVEQKVKVAAEFISSLQAALKGEKESV
ncbi:MAG: tryptophan synthase subunit alpha [Dethiobacter sp.]|jgi:tryptophan synthase alpha chain|nr:tryptophan synthase subunit alpha [Dethiobacter sp.]